MAFKMKMKEYGKGKNPIQFNEGLRKASAEGKLDDNPKFKAAVDKGGDSPAKFLGMGKSPSQKAAAGGGLTGKKVLKGLLNPAGAIANKMGMGDTALGKVLNPGKLLGL